MENINIIQKYLTDILSIPSPTGYTDEISNYIKKELKKLGVEYKVSNKGIVIATIKGKNEDKEITFSSHIDTLGAMVKEIKPNGKIAITLIGGYMLNTIEGENCIIHTRKGEKYEATLQTIKPSVHIDGNKAKELPRTEQNYELIIDEEVFTKKDIINLGIDVGDIISFDTRFRITKSGFIKSRYLDDKASVAAILYTINHLVLNSIVPNNTVNFFFSNYEEVGHGSSAFIPKNTSEFIAIDMGCVGEGQNSTEYDVSICTKDSNGPYDYCIIKKIIQVCCDKSINYKLDIYPNYGSDATAALKSGMDAKFALVGPGIFASHGYERTHIKSIVETSKLIINYIQI